VPGRNFFSKKDARKKFLKISSKSTTCFSNTLEKKITAVETTPLPGQQRTFCQIRGGVPPPANVEHSTINNK
jgi:hypothetical protein